MVKEIVSQYDAILNKPHNNYSEGVSSGHFFVLMDDKGQAKNAPAMCKDYFQDYFWACYTGKKVNQQYGYSCDPEELCDTYRFIVGYSNFAGKGWNGNKYTIPCILPTSWRPNVQRFLDNLSSDLHLSSIKVSLDNSKKLLVITFRKDWTEKPYILSLLTYCIRIACYISYEDFLQYSFEENPNPFLSLNNDNSTKYNNVRDKLLKLIEKGGNLPEQTWDKFEQQAYAHNNSGIITMNI